MTKQKTVAITGANGFLGSALVDYFAVKGWNVVALVRNPTRFVIKQKKVSAKQYDMSEPLAEDILKNTDALIHAAYIKQTRDSPDSYDRNLHAAENLLAQAKCMGVGRLVFISSMSAHDDAISVYGKQKLASEKLFLQQNATVLRPGLILGNGGIVKEMSDFMRTKHVVPLVDGGKQPLQVIALYDLVTTIEHAIDLNLGGLLTVATPDVYSYKEFYHELSKALDVKVLYVPVPYSILMGAFQLIAFLRIPVGVGADNLKGLKMLKAVSTTNDLKKLNVAIDPLPLALKKLLQVRKGEA